ncbi:MAG: hypothetical protein ACPGJV_10805 [Bacteriovoracaceae bacterium]
MDFGIFLLDQEAIDGETLIEAYIEQQQSSPPLMKILLHEMGINALDLIKVIKFQDKNQIDFIRALKESNLIAQETIIQAFRLKSEKSKSLSEILVEKRKLNQDICKSLLEKFLSLSPQAQEPDNVKREASEPSAQSPGINQAALDSLKELMGSGDIDEVMIKELESPSDSSSQDESSPERQDKSDSLGLSEKLKNLKNGQDTFDKDFTPEILNKYNAKKIVSFSKAFKMYMQNKSFDDSFQEITTSLHEIVGIAKLANAHNLSLILEVLEHAMRNLDKNDTPTKEQLELLHTLFSLSVKVRNHIEQNQTEENLYEETLSYDLLKKQVAQAIQIIS